MVGDTLHVCINCTHPDYKSRKLKKAGGEAVLEILQSKIQESNSVQPITVKPIICLGNCGKRCRVSISGPKKWSWLFGELSPDKDLSEFIEVIEKWQEEPDGFILKEERSKWLVRHTLGRTPPLNLK